MKIDRDDMLYASHGEQVGEHPSRDRPAMRLLFRLTRVWEISLTRSASIPENVEIKTGIRTA